jgi:CheY-like chemotaxis protein
MRAAGPLRGRRILIIEDDDDTREAFRRLLESRGAHVMVAADGLEGLVQLDRRRPDAILCDLAMPIMDGIEFARHMRNDPRYRRVLLIAITGRGRQGDFTDTWSVGFDGHLVKPLTEDALHALTQRLARHATSRTGHGA